MKTIVYQSYRTINVPTWVQKCLQTVQGWAKSNHFDYELIDDRLFNYAPDWFRQKANHQICPISDLARLLVAKEFLSSGYDRTIWVDADIVVFAPEKLNVNAVSDFAFCHEVWLEQAQNGQILHSHRVNNSVTIFTKDNAHLDFLIDSCLRIARHKHQLNKLDVGTNLLSQLRNIIPFPLLENVGMLSPLVMIDIYSGNESFLKAYTKNISEPISCANLCGSLQGWKSAGMVADDSFYERIVDECLRTHGAVINRLWKLNKNDPLL